MERLAKELKLEKEELERLKTEVNGMEHDLMQRRLRRVSCTTAIPTVSKLLVFNSTYTFIFCVLMKLRYCSKILLSIKSSVFGDTFKYLTCHELILVVHEMDTCAVFLVFPTKLQKLVCMHLCGPQNCIYLVP